MPSEINHDLDQTVSNLIDKSYKLLEDNDYKGVLKIGKKLKKLKHSSAFEILALAYEGEDKKDKAIKILEEGVQVAPGFWVLWQLLGNYYSDMEEFEKSYNAYDKAIICQDTNISSVSINYSIALMRNGKYEKALEYIDNVSEGEIYSYSISLRLEILNRLGKYKIVIDEAKKILANVSEIDGMEEYLPDIYAELGYANWYLNKDPKTALEYAWKAISLNKFVDTAQWLIREVDNLYSPKVKYYVLTIEGIGYDNDKSCTRNFLVRYEVVADDENEALNFIHRFEPDEIRDSLKIYESKILKKTPEYAKGVYFVSGYIYFGNNI